MRGFFSLDALIQVIVPPSFDLLVFVVRPGSESMLLLFFVNRSSLCGNFRGESPFQFPLCLDLARNTARPHCFFRLPHAPFDVKNQHKHY